MPKEVWTARLVGTGWVVELGSLNGRVLRQFPFRHGVRLLLRILSLLSFFSVDSTQDRLGRLPNDSRNIPPSLSLQYCFTYFHRLLACTRSLWISLSKFTKSRPGSAGDSRFQTDSVGWIFYIHRRL